MKFAAECRIEECASKEVRRYNSHQVYLDIEESEHSGCVGHLVATDGRALCAIPVELEVGDMPGLVSVKAIREAREQAVGGKARLKCGKRLVLPDGTSMPRPEGVFLTWRNYMLEKNAAVVLSLDASLLLKIAEGAGVTRVQLSIIDEKSPLRITPLSSDGTRGAECVLVQVTADENTQDYSAVSCKPGKRWTDAPDERTGSPKVAALKKITKAKRSGKKKCGRTLSETEKIAP